MSIDPTRSIRTHCDIPEERNLSADPISYSRGLVAQATKIFTVAPMIFSIYFHKQTCIISHSPNRIRQIKVRGTGHPRNADT